MGVFWLLGLPAIQLSQNESIKAVKPNGVDKLLKKVTGKSPRIGSSSSPTVAIVLGGELREAVGHFRWVICALLFLATTINYIDRQVLGILAAPLQREIGWSESDYGLIVTSFQAAYALALVASGKGIDLIGTRVGYALAIAWWSLAAMGHGLARSALGFGVARFALGMGEAGNFPAAIKTVAEWFPRRERALATGIFNSGSNVGAVIAPLLVPWIALHLGWRWAFVFTGAIGFLWLILWLIIYRQPHKHPHLSQAELTYIQDQVEESSTPLPWRCLLTVRQTWGLSLARFVTDPIWWFYLYWVPKFLNSKHGLTLDRIGPPLVIIYLAADVGSIGGGWLSSHLIRQGWNAMKARQAAMLLCALSVIPMVFASGVSSLWVAVALLGVATAAHQGWSANVFTLVSDLYPKRAVASVVGICGFSGSIGGMLFAAATGWVLQWTGSYLPMFVVAGTTYLFGLGIVHSLTCRRGVVKL